MIVPSSSSSSMNVTPFAVAGRWRAITRPATRTRRPCGCVSSSALVLQVGGQRRAHQLERVLAQRHARRAVVGQHPLPGRSARAAPGPSCGSSGSASWVPSAHLRRPAPPRPAARAPPPPALARPRRRARRMRPPRRAVPSVSAEAPERPARSPSERQPPPRSRSATSARTSASARRSRSRVRSGRGRPPPGSSAPLRTTHGGSTSTPRRCASCTSASGG